MHEKRLKNPNRISISCKKEDLATIVTKWQERTEKCEDIDFYMNQGGDNWLLNNLMTHPKDGIKSKTIEQRIGLYGDN